jgi:hypothetical protein
MRVLGILLIAVNFCVAASGNIVVLKYGGTTKLRELIADRLTVILNSLDEKELPKVRAHCTEEGWASLKVLVEKTNIKALGRVYYSYLIALQTEYFEVRDIAVRINADGDHLENLVFTLNKDGLVSSVRFALEDSIYKKIVEWSEDVGNRIEYAQILQFLETLRTAYNRKDLNYIETVFGENSLIIVGSTLRENKDGSNTPEKYNLSKPTVQLIRRSKQTYFDKLKKVFETTAFIKVLYEDVQIRKHPSFKEIYGVSFKQIWHSSTYSDEGYIFLLIDFLDINRPLIHLSAWQPMKFIDNNVTSLMDFKIIQ